MSVRQGFLALLSERPMHGYQLRKRLNLMLGWGRVLSYGSLYPALKKMLRANLITEASATTTAARKSTATKTAPATKATARKTARPFSLPQSATHSPLASTWMGLSSTSWVSECALSHF